METTTVIVILCVAAAAATVGWSLYKTLSGKDDACGCDCHCSKNLSDGTEASAEPKEK